MKNTLPSEPTPDSKPERKLEVTPSPSFAPDTSDQVQVVFEPGTMRSPYIAGGLWKGDSKPPENSGK